MADFLAEYKNGQIVTSDPSRFKEVLSNFKGFFTLTVKKPTKLRSNPENRYFHGVLLKTLSDELGYTIDEMKGIVKWALKKKYDFDFPKSSHASTIEFEKAMELAREWAMIDLGIYIAEPNEEA